jgi:hypothetical protein
MFIASLQHWYDVECNSDRQAALLVALLAVFNIHARQHNGFTAYEAFDIFNAQLPTVSDIS